MKRLPKNPILESIKVKTYFPADDINLILSARTVSLAEIKPIKDEVSSLRNELDSIRMEIQRITPELRITEERVLPSFRRDMEKFNELKRKLLRDVKYKGKFVAIYNEEIVGVNDDDSELSQLLDEKYGNVPAYIGKVVEEEEVVELSSPELT